mmetsp:Transcript_5338/g.15245  ORF Transcript_5338/g.15245 Transcript_5338/m.15245 type:complete len:267 (+) Transcript_5338:86-886(+)
MPGSPISSVTPTEGSRTTSSILSFSSSLGLLTRWSNSYMLIWVLWGDSVTQWIFFSGVLKSPSGSKVASRAVTSSLSSVCTLVHSKTPQLRSTNFSPTLMRGTASLPCTSSCSMSTLGPRKRLLKPNWLPSLSLGRSGTVLCDSGNGFPSGPTTLIGMLLSRATAMKRGATGSMYFLLKFQNLSHSSSTAFLEPPCATIKSSSALSCMPRRRMPLTVGKRGSSQPGTRLVSTNHLSLRLDMSVYTKLRREKSWISTGRRPSLGKNH